MKALMLCVVVFGLVSSACSSVEVVSSTASSKGDGSGGTTTTTSTTLTSSSTTTTSTTTSSDGGGGAVGAGGAGDGGGTDMGGAGGSDVCPPPDFVPATKLLIDLDPAVFPSRNIVAGKDVWVPITAYTITNVTDADQAINSAEIHQTYVLTGDIADFSEAAIAMEGVVRLSGHTIGQQWNQNGDLEDFFYITDVAPQGFIIPAHTTKGVQIWAKVAPVLSAAAAGGAWHGVSRSGHVDVLRLDSVGVDSDPPCFAQANLHLAVPPFVVIRKSVPTIVNLPLSNNTLANIDLDLIKFQVAADAMGPVSWKQLCFGITKPLAMIGISNFRLRRGGGDLSLADYDIVTINGLNQNTGGVVDESSSSWTVCVKMTSEETIAGSGNVYTLHGTVSGVSSGVELNVAMVNDNSVGTGFLIPNQNGVLSLMTMGGPISSWGAWSDNSEVPHVPDVALDGGSRDWFTGALLQTSDVQEHFTL